MLYYSKKLNIFAVEHVYSIHNATFAPQNRDFWLAFLSYFPRVFVPRFGISTYPSFPKSTQNINLIHENI